LFTKAEKLDLFEGMLLKGHKLIICVGRNKTGNEMLYQKILLDTKIGQKVMIISTI